MPRVDSNIAELVLPRGCALDVIRYDSMNVPKDAAELRPRLAMMVLARVEKEHSRRWLLRELRANAKPRRKERRKDRMVWRRRCTRRGPGDTTARIA